MEAIGRMNFGMLLLVWMLASFVLSVFVGTFIRTGMGSDEE